MLEGLIDAIAALDRPADPRINGVVPAVVIDNQDMAGLGRVQLRLPFMPGVEPWARVATLAAGPERGSYFIPQVDDEVVVAFNNGDIRDPYVLGSVWGPSDKPPAGTNPLDARNRRVIRTPEGHVVEFDDAKRTITVTSADDHHIEIATDHIEVSTSKESARVRLGTDGVITLKAKTRIELKAPEITADADSRLKLGASGTASLESSAECRISGSIVRIN